MPLTIRRLGPLAEDIAILRLLAVEDADFDIDGRGGDEPPLDDADGATFLADPGVVFWAALEDGRAVGFLGCQLVRKRSGEPRELLLYEIGVRAAFRRKGVGRALLDAMTAWMGEHDVPEVWVLADNDVATLFYRGCGFASAEDQPVYLTRRAVASGRSEE